MKKKTKSHPKHHHKNTVQKNLSPTLWPCPLKGGGRDSEKRHELAFSFHGRCVSVSSGQISQSKGLVSIDRSEAAALLSTTPRLRPRSSTNDLAPLHCMGWISFRHVDGESRPPRRAVMLWLSHRGRRGRSARAYRCLPTSRR